MPKHLRIRVADALYEKLAASAGESPLTGEVVRRLEQSFDREALLAQVREAVVYHAPPISYPIYPMGSIQQPRGNTR